MSRLNQIIAIEKGVKSRAHEKASELYKAIQKPDLFNGFSKTYQKVDEAGEDLPAESKRVQFSAVEVLREVARSKSELMTVEARKDWSNCEAKADVEVGGKVLIPGAPVSHLLFLEKELNDIRTFASTVPTLDSNESWSLDSSSGLYKAAETKTHRTKKVQKPIVLYDATDKHPAQTQLINEDVIAGFWTQVKQSGALPKTERDKIVERVETLIHAVKQAREKANMTDEADAPPVGAAVFDYLLNGG